MVILMLVKDTNMDNKGKEKIIEQTKEILTKKLNQLFVLFRYSNSVKIPLEWFEIAIPDGIDISQNRKFKIVNIIKINEEFFKKLMLEHNIKVSLTKDQKNYCFYKIDK